MSRIDTLLRGRKAHRPEAGNAAVSYLGTALPLLFAGEQEQTTGIDIFPTIVTPATVEAKTRQVEAFIFALNRDFRETGTPADANFLAGWGQFTQAFGKFSASIERGGIGVLLASKANMSTVEQYERDAIEWQKKFSAMGGKTNTPTPVPPPPDASDDTIKTVAIAGAVIAGAVAIALMVRK